MKCSLCGREEFATVSGYCLPCEIATNNCSIFHQMPMDRDRLREDGIDAGAELQNYRDYLSSLRDELFEYRSYFKSRGTARLLDGAEKIRYSKLIREIADAKRKVFELTAIYSQLSGLFLHWKEEQLGLNRISDDPDFIRKYLAPPEERQD